MIREGGEKVDLAKAPKAKRRPHQSVTRVYREDPEACAKAVLCALETPQTERDGLRPPYCTPRG